MKKIFTLLTAILLMASMGWAQKQQQMLSTAVSENIISNVQNNNTQKKDAKQSTKRRNAAQTVYPMYSSDYDYLEVTQKSNGVFDIYLVNENAVQILFQYGNLSTGKTNCIAGTHTMYDCDCYDYFFYDGDDGYAVYAPSGTIQITFLRMGNEGYPIYNVRFDVQGYWQGSSLCSYSYEKELKVVSYADYNDTELTLEDYYTITVEANNGAYGTVSGSGSYGVGTNQTITAFNNGGFIFKKWLKNGSDFSGNTTASLSVNISGNDTYTAYFEAAASNSTITLNNQSATTAGTASVTATLNANTNLNGNPAITVPTKTNRHFGGYYTGTNGTGVQIIDANGNFIASAGGNNTYLDGSKNWKYPSNITLNAYWYYTISVAASGNGTVGGAGNYYEGSNTNLTATPSNSNYYLYDWEKNGVSRAVRTTPLVESINADATYTAVFREKEWTLTVNSDNTSLGTVTGSGKYYNGENATITATPANSFTTFVKWQKNGVDVPNSTASMNVTVNANDEYVAVFSGRNVIEVDIPAASYTDKSAVYALRGNSAGGTSDTGSGYYVGVQLNSSSDAFYQIENITYNGNNLSFSNYEIEGHQQPCGNRVITHFYCYNATGDVYHFIIHWLFPFNNDVNSGWSCNYSSIERATYDATWNAVEIYCQWSQKEFNDQMSYKTLDLLFVTGERCADNVYIPEGTYPINCSGDINTVRAYESGMGNNYCFAWEQGGGIDYGNKRISSGTVTVSRSGSNYTIVVDAKNSYGQSITSTITGSISIDNIPSYNLNVTTDGNGTASVKRYDCNGDLNTVSNSGSYKQGASFQLEAVPSSGYAFDYWTMAGSEEQYELNPIDLEGLYSAASITAHFKTSTNRTITLTAPTNGTITVHNEDTDADVVFTENAATIADGTTLTITANGITGYHCTGITVNDEPLVGSTYTVDGDFAIAATFAPNTNTGYTVNHYQQNLDGTYPSTPTETDNLTGTTATNVTPAVKSYTGFTAPSTQTVSILADGSRVVEYQYTRNSYTLTWNANGGNLTGGTTAGSVPYGTPLTAPTATKSGFDFTGWTTAVPATMPAEAFSTTAQWIEVFALIDSYNAGNDYYETLVDKAGQTMNVRYERTFPAGEWAAFSLPFGYSFQKEGNNTFRDQVYYLISAEYEVEGGKAYLTLNCMPNTLGIVANKPYVLIPNETIVNPVFNNVKMKAQALNYYNVPCTNIGVADPVETVEFRNTLTRMQFANNDHRQIYLVGSKLRYPNNGTSIRAFRGYFYMQEGTIQHIQPRLRNAETGEIIEAEEETNTTVETKKYIENGILVIERAGMKYDAQGHIIK